MNEGHLSRLLNAGFNVLVSKDSVTYSPERWSVSDFDGKANADLESVIRLEHVLENPKMHTQIILLPGLM